MGLPKKEGGGGLQPWGFHYAAGTASLRTIIDRGAKSRCQWLKVKNRGIAVPESRCQRSRCQWLKVKGSKGTTRRHR
jgi:hypothetical protein